MSTKQHAAIAALLSTPTVPQAAKTGGVSERQLYRWLADDRNFDVAYRAARWRATQHAIARLQQTAGAAVTILLSIAADKHAPASSRVTAACKVIDLALRSVEIEELESRLANLEALTKEKGT